VSFEPLPLDAQTACLWIAEVALLDDVCQPINLGLQDADAQVELFAVSLAPRDLLKQLIAAQLVLELGFSQFLACLTQRAPWIKYAHNSLSF
jgi:hypothetical protein